MPWHPVMLSTSRRISELSPAAFTALLEGDNESGSSEARMAAAMAEKSLLLVQLCVVEGLSVVAQDALDVTGHAEHQEVSHGCIPEPAVLSQTYGGNDRKSDGEVPLV